jgi:hypothetical protein
VRDAQPAQGAGEGLKHAQRAREVRVVGLKHARRAKGAVAGLKHAPRAKMAG